MCPAWDAPQQDLGAGEERRAFSRGRAMTCRLWAVLPDFPRMMTKRQQSPGPESQPKSPRGRVERKYATVILLVLGRPLCAMIHRLFWLVRAVACCCCCQSVVFSPSGSSVSERSVCFPCCDNPEHRSGYAHEFIMFDACHRSGHEMLRVPVSPSRGMWRHRSGVSRVAASQQSG